MGELAPGSVLERDQGQDDRPVLLLSAFSGLDELLERPVRRFQNEGFATASGVSLAVTAILLSGRPSPVGTLGRASTLWPSVTAA